MVLTNYVSHMVVTQLTETQELSMKFGIPNPLLSGNSHSTLLIISHGFKTNLTHKSYGGLCGYGIGEESSVIPTQVHCKILLRSVPTIPSAPFALDYSTICLVNCVIHTYSVYEASKHLPAVMH